MYITRNQAAFATASVASFATVGSVIAASTSDSKTSTAAFSVLAIASSAGTISSLSAWAATEKRSTAEEYFNTFADHFSKVFVGIASTASQILIKVAFESAAEGLGKGISSKIEDFISGKKPDKKKPDDK